MGSEIALNYKKAGMLGSVHDVDPRGIPPEVMAHYEKNLDTLLTSNDTILLALPDDKSVNDTCSSISKLSSNCPKLVLDCSTISPDLSLNLHNLLRPLNVNFMDCPVSGGTFVSLIHSRCHGCLRKIPDGDGRSNGIRGEGH